MSLTDRDLEMGKAKWLTGIKKMADITGAAVSGVAGLLANSPLTAAAGGAIGVIIAQTITEVASRALSQREDIRRNIVSPCSSKSYLSIITSY